MIKNATIVSWNVGGGKFLTLPKEQRVDFRSRLNLALEDLAARHSPDFVLLQEVVTYDEGGHLESLVQPPAGYHSVTSTVLDTRRQSYPARWQRFRDEGGWPRAAYLGQGHSLLWQRELPHCPIWEFDCPRKTSEIEVEEVRLDTGLYTGTRDTEPRLAVVAHFVYEATTMPLDVFVVNLHLTTLKGEREGSPQKDDLGSQIRSAQVDIVLHGIVSRYNEWRQRTHPDIRRAPPVWILGGDFNCVPESLEILKMKRRNFIDLNPHKGAGTKRAGLGPSPATITVDYIFGGPKYYALDQYFVERKIDANPLPIDTVTVSDHFPLVAVLPISIPVGRGET